ncbi:restriction endonuclease subunit S [Streptomyces arenae]|uniref:restriction endonuclease subunit S n=1 Tax=Streptomyces arenae TaxID=29301 RepID=UPI002658FBBC|nr:restriction endonuclease subunit S [Streptomyces arenae]MCG7209802.1 restriction endonuclease subunit S [Streptomyces arenae]
MRSDLDYGVWNPDSNITNYKLVEPDDFVIGLRSFQHGISHSAVRGLVSPAYTVLRSAGDLDPTFFKYYFRSSLLISHLANITQGIRQGQAIDIEAFQNLPVPVPELEEQRSIADFLDAETARIDKLVRLRSTQSSLIGESLAAEAVDLTGRSQIRRDGGTTESTVQLRRAAMSTQTGSTPATLYDLSGGSAPEASIPWYTPAAIDSWMSITTPEKATRRNGVPLFPADSVLITGIGESLGKVAYLDHVATGNQQLTAITPQVGVSGRFMAWQLWAAEQEIREWAQYSRIRIINNDSLKSFPIYLPSRAEQDTVVRTLDSRMARVRQITDAFLRFQRLADERRQSLITAAVTGQFDVSTAGGRNVTDGVTA